MNTHPEGGILLVFGGEELFLLPSRSLWWPGRRILFVADLHLGKSRSFHQFGIPVPDCSPTDTGRLAGVITQLNIEQCFVLGDLIHDEFSVDPNLLHNIENLISTTSLNSLHIIRGNHDRHTKQIEKIPDVIWHDENYQIGPFYLRHHPPESAGSIENKSPHVIHGHIHPGTMIQAGSGRGGRFPCFVLEDSTRLILPALGTFTGLQPVRPSKRRQIFPVIEGNVMRWPPRSR